MTERERLLNHLEYLERDSQPGIVATVFQVSGSNYRRAGARMLFQANGETVGILSGGCLDLEKHAQHAMDSDCTSVHRFDTTGPMDVLMGSGSGCQGVIDVLLAPVQDGYQPSLRTCMEPAIRGNPSVLATVVDTGKDGSPARLGSRLLVCKDVPAQGSLGDAELEAAVERDARLLIGSERVDINLYQIAEHTVKVMVEGMMPLRRLVVFGAGNDAAPLAEIGSQVGLHVTLVDHRPAYADPKRHPAAAKVLHINDAVEAVHRVAPDVLTACVSVTHDYLRDVAILREIQNTPASYIGVIGPRSRAEQLIAESAWADADRGRLYCPAGLDVGAQSPDEIALSVIAEIMSVLASRKAGHLRDRASPIHDRLPYANK